MALLTVRGTNHYCSLPLQYPDYRKTWFDTESIWICSFSGSIIWEGGYHRKCHGLVNRPGKYGFTRCIPHCESAQRHAHNACKRNVLRDQMCGYVTYRYRSIYIYNWCILISRSFTQHGLFCIVNKSTWMASVACGHKVSIQRFSRARPRSSEWPNHDTSTAEPKVRTLLRRPGQCHNRSSWE